MRVAYFTLAPFISGAERSLQTTVEALPSAGIEPLLVCPSGSSIIPWCQSRGVPFRVCSYAWRDKWHPYRWWRCVREVRNMLRQECVDVVHSNQLCSYQGPGAAARAIGLPRLCHLRDENAPEALRWHCSYGVEGILCISRHIERQTREAWPEGHGRPDIQVLLNPVKLRELPSDDQRMAAARAARRGWGIPEEAVVFGFIGQIRPVKGLLELIEALSEVPTHRPWHLLIAGRDHVPGSPYEAVCRARAKSMGLDRHMTFLGFLDDTDDFYNAVDVVVVPSLAEPLGRVPLEAAAHAKAAVAFAVGGLPETIRHGETGYLIPACDIPGLRGALAKSLTEPLDVMGLKARRWVEQACDPGAYVKSLAKVYRKLLSRKRRSIR